MSRRKHVLQSLDQEVEPPGEGQYIVRAVGSRGSNIIEVEFPDGRTTLCLLPAKFHKKLWIKKGNFLIVEDAEDSDSRVTGQILAVLFADQVKQLRRLPGVWPAQFEATSSSAVSTVTEQLSALVVESSSHSDGAANSLQCSSSRLDDTQQSAAAGIAQVSASAAGTGPTANEEQGYSSSDDELPPIPKFNNRKVIEYEVSDSESEDD